MQTLAFVMAKKIMCMYELRMYVCMLICTADTRYIHTHTHTFVLSCVCVCVFLESDKNTGSGDKRNFLKPIFVCL